ncbi:MAG: hypothetical protein H0T54_02015 [Geodermatophilaceae bacterium]|nr:hypothetical protein [Geodermatophilaceae bacterium]
MAATAAAPKVSTGTQSITRPRPALRLVPAVAPSMRRGPFIVLVLALVILGTVGLLILNTVIAADSFRVQQLIQRNAELAVTEQGLQRQVNEGLSPQALAEAARELGMIPAGQPGFILVGPDGSIVVQGNPVPAGAR